MDKELVEFSVASCRATEKAHAFLSPYETLPSARQSIPFAGKLAIQYSVSGKTSAEVDGNSKFLPYFHFYRHKVSRLQLKAYRMFLLTDLIPRIPREGLANRHGMQQLMSVTWPAGAEARNETAWKRSRTLRQCWHLDSADWGYSPGTLQCVFSHTTPAA